MEIHDMKELKWPKSMMMSTTKGTKASIVIFIRIAGMTLKNTWS